MQKNLSLPVRAYLVGTGFPDEFRQICVRGGWSGGIGGLASGGGTAGGGCFGGMRYNCNSEAIALELDCLMIF